MRISALGQECVALGLALHPFGDERDAQLAAQRDDGSDELGPDRRSLDLAKQGHLELDRVRLQHGQAAESRPGSGDVADGDAVAEGTQALHSGHEVVAVLEGRLLGDLEKDVIGDRCQRRARIVQILIEELEGVKVDEYRGHRLAREHDPGHVAADALSERHELVDVTGHLEHLLWRRNRGLGAAQQRLVAGHALARPRDDGLEGHPKSAQGPIEPFPDLP